MSRRTLTWLAAPCLFVHGLAACTLSVHDNVGYSEAGLSAVEAGSGQESGTVLDGGAPVDSMVVVDTGSFIDSGSPPSDDSGPAPGKDSG
jgi:hypothetical protein